MRQTDTHRPLNVSSVGLCVSATLVDFAAYVQNCYVFHLTVNVVTVSHKRSRLAPVDISQKRA